MRCRSRYCPIEQDQDHFGRCAPYRRVEREDWGRGTQDIRTCPPLGPITAGVSYVFAQQRNYLFRAHCELALNCSPSAVSDMARDRRREEPLRCGTGTLMGTYVPMAMSGVIMFH